MFEIINLLFVRYLNSFSPFFLNRGDSFCDFREVVPSGLAVVLATHTRVLTERRVNKATRQQNKQGW